MFNSVMLCHKLYHAMVFLQAEEWWNNLYCRACGKLM